MTNDGEKALQVQIANALLRTNHMLGYENQLRPDDPLISFVALNETLYKAYLEALKQTTSEAQAAFNAALQKELEQAKSITAEMIEQTGRHLQDQLEDVGVAWEAKFQFKVDRSIAQIQDITQLNFIGAVCWFLSGAVMMGIILCKLWFG
jgi:hypothetical protein